MDEWESARPTTPASTTTTTNPTAKRKLDDSEDPAGFSGVDETRGFAGFGISATVRGRADLLKSLAASNSSSTLG